jgi:hypothetical protein
MAETGSYIPPQSPIAIQPGDKGFEVVGKGYNRWLWTFSDWKKGKKKIINPNTNWQLNSKPMSSKEIEKKMKNLYLENDNLDEKSVSKSQQAIMGQAWALRKGSLKISDIDPRYKEEIKKIAFGYRDDSGKKVKPMSDKELLKFAKTKTSNLPASVNESDGTKIIKSSGLPSFVPNMNLGGGIKPIVPFLNPDSKKEKAGKRNLENLKDYRDWIEDSKK